MGLVPDRLSCAQWPPPAGSSCVEAGARQARELLLWTQSSRRCRVIAARAARATSPRRRSQSLDSSSAWRGAGSRTRRASFRAVLAQSRKAHRVSSVRSTLDGTLIGDWASLTSFEKNDAQDDDLSPPDDPGNPTVNFPRRKRGNETHASTTDQTCGSRGRSKQARVAPGRGGWTRGTREVALSMLDES